MALVNWLGEFCAPCGRTTQVYCFNAWVNANKYWQEGSNGTLKKAFAKSMTVKIFADGGTPDRRVCGLGTSGVSKTVASFTALRSCTNRNLSGPVPRYYRYFLAYVLAIQEINSNSDILPNVTLGYHATDSCRHVVKAIEGVLCILSGQRYAVPNYSCQNHDNLIGIIGDQSSDTSLHMAQLLNIYGYAQISYGATDPLLTNKLFYPSFFQTLPGDQTQCLAIIKLLKHFGWTWIGVITSEDDAGEKQSQELTQQAAEHGICIEYTISLPSGQTSKRRSTLNKRKQTLYSSTSNVVVLCGTVSLYPIYFIESECKFGHVKTLVVSANPIPHLQLNAEGKSSLHGSLIFSPNTKTIPDLKRFLEETTVTNNPVPTSSNHQKYLPAVPASSTHRQYKPAVTTRSTCQQYQPAVPTSNTHWQYQQAVTTSSTHWQYKPAVPTSSNHQKYLPAVPASSTHRQYKPAVPTSSNHQKYLPAVPASSTNQQYPTAVLASSTHKQYPPAVPALEDSRQQLPTIPAWGTAAASDTCRNPEEEVKIEIPVSTCSEHCPPGYRSVMKRGLHRCCFECLQCSEGEISNETDKGSCHTCPEDQWPNDNRCVPKPVEYLAFRSETIIQLVSIMSVLLFLKTSTILGIFIVFRDTPLVRANNQTLSFILLISIMLSFISVFLFLGRPVHTTCMLRQTSFAIIFSVAISSILAKTIMVYSAFKATKPGSPWRRFIGIKITNCLVFLCSFIQVLISIIWLSISPPYPESNTHLYVDKIIIQCNEGSVVAFSILLGYMGLLAAVTLIMAFLARNLPDSFNEAKYITFSMLVFCSVWVSFIPAYMSVTGKNTVLVEIFAIIASSWGILGCIFLPKCYVILVRPDLNSKSNLLKQAHNRLSNNM
ncbi:vomeronasal type-2 receptor 26-like [Rana temporaria]|uniref:vomeronasal type-2 receptor 26-like n=1 Tax=Rana temporaria TaxID=8407 RepID=UPI001AAD4679|nr:vomeronasal type-2 receptor 26-like [Rana temporaria]